MSIIRDTHGNPIDTDKVTPDSAGMYRWGTFAGQYTYEVTWSGVRVTVECDSEDGDQVRSMLPVRVLAGGVDITDIVDYESGELQELVQAEHEAQLSSGNYAANQADMEMDEV